MNAMGLLGSLLQGGSRRSSRGNTLEQLAGSMLGGQNTNVAGIGALAGSLLSGGSKSVKGALGGGALAMLGSLAFKAYQDSQQNSSNQTMSSKTQLMSGMREPETSEEEAEVQSMVLLILKAMINAAKADGHIDEQEMNKIVGKAKEDGLGDDEQQFIMEEINKPMDTEGLITAAASDSQIGAQLYTASLLAIEVDTDEERNYLNELAAGLGLSDNVVNYLHTTVGVA